jgi:uncharacterized protein (UPF0335 family)
MNQKKKERIDYLEKENKDLNDYITLVNKQLIEAQESEDAVSQASVGQIKALREQIKSLESERTELASRVQSLQTLSNKQPPVRENLNELFNSSGSGGELAVSKDHLRNMKLLEV